MRNLSDIQIKFEKENFTVGKKVRIIRGSLKGLEGSVTEVKNKMSEVIVRLEYLGCASLSINTSELEVIN